MFKFHGRFLTANTAHKRHHFCVFSFLQISRTVSDGENYPQTAPLLCVFVSSKFTGGFRRHKLPANYLTFVYVRLFKIHGRFPAAQTTSLMCIFVSSKPAGGFWQRKLSAKCIIFCIFPSNFQNSRPGSGGANCPKNASKMHHFLCFRFFKTHGL